MRFVLFCLAAIAVVVSVRPVLAHGGAYRGPSGEVPPSVRDPKDPQPPGPCPPPPPCPSEPPPAPPDPQPPKRPEETAPGNGPPRRDPYLMDYSNWIFWWAYNKDAILLRRTGAGPRTLSDAARKRIVSALETTIANRGLHPDIRAGAIIALARTDPSRRALPPLLELAAREGKEENLVRESAMLALGLIGLREPEVRAGLLTIVGDREDAMRGRCFAMIALGLLRDDHEDVRRALEARITGDERQLDAPVCALMALGLIGHAESVPKLIGWLDQGRAGAKKLTDLERSWVVAALGKIGHADALAPILRALKVKGHFTHRSVAIAIGRLVPAAEASAAENVRLLARYYRTETDLTARNFTVVSMGRIAADPRTPEAAKELANRFLGWAYTHVDRMWERPFVALAIGLAGGWPERVELLRTDLAVAKTNEIARGAHAIALGLLRDAESVPVLTKILADRGAEWHFRGAAATGLGLTGDARANEAILDSLAAREDRILRVDTAMATGLLAPPKAVAPLLATFDDWKSSQFALGSTAMALGWIGDERAIDLLIGILEPDTVNGKYPDLTRGLAAAALGILADRREHRVLHRLSEDLNYRAMVPALDEMLTIL